MAVKVLEGCRYNRGTGKNHVAQSRGSRKTFTRPDPTCHAGPSPWAWAPRSTYQLLDLTAKGRDEPSEGNPQFWVRRHDEYGR